MNRRLCAKILERAGFSVALARHGGEAVARFESGERFDLVLMDCRMPVMDGYTATATIRELEAEGECVPIIAITADSLDTDRDRCLAGGMTELLRKPFRPIELVDLVEFWLLNERKPLE